MAEEEEEAANTFSNDGSFMEQFMKMQKEKEKEKEKSCESEKVAKSGVVLKPVVKRPPPTSLVQKMMKNRAAKKLASAGRSGAGGGVRGAGGGGSGASGGVMGDGGASGASEGVSGAGGEGGGKEGGTERKKGPDPSTTPSSTVAMADQSSEGAPSSSSSLSASIPTPQPAPAETKGGRKRKRWDVSSSESTSDSRTIHDVIDSFSAAPSPSLGAGSSVGGEQLHLSAAQLEQLREQIAMQKMVAEIKAATAQASASDQKNQYEYDSDEEVDGGTWEHKARVKEMKFTEVKAHELTELGKGKHHIGDFLPPEELEKFVETISAVKEDREPDLSDYKEHKLTEDNIGFQLLQKSGWDEGTGLGAQQQGITAPINKGKQSFDQSGLGTAKPAEVDKSDNEFDLYRKRMMLAYRFRPNPLNNPRRSYY